MKRLKGRMALAVLILGLTLNYSFSASAGEIGRLDLGPDKQLGTTITREPGGVVKITARGNSTICLGRMERPSVTDGRLAYQALVRAEGLKGRVFLEMWCVFPGGGRYFSRGLNDALTGDQPWRKMSTSFVLKRGQRPASVTLGLVVFGEGTVWVKEPRLVMIPEKNGGKR